MTEQANPVGPEQAILRLQFDGLSPGIWESLGPLLNPTGLALGQTAFHSVVREVMLDLASGSRELAPGPAREIKEYEERLRPLEEKGRQFPLLAGATKFIVGARSHAIEVRFELEITDRERGLLYGGPFFPDGDPDPTEPVIARMRLPKSILTPFINYPPKLNEIERSYQQKENYLQRQRFGTTRFLNKLSIVRLPSRLPPAHLDPDREAGQPQCTSSVRFILTTQRILIDN
jgi:hypothetical protein